MEVLKDKDCTINTPVVLGVQDSPIYGKGVSIKPRVDGRKDSKHFESIYLPELLPLEEYDLIVVLISGGKDSIACFYKLLELGVPKEKIELWHHDIDGGHPSRRMDWKCTQNYMKALADAEGVKLRVSYRVNGFFGELYRIGASEPIEWIDPDTGEIKQCKLSSNFLKCQEIKRRAGTLNVPGIVGMGKAAELAKNSLETRSKKEIILREHLIQRILNEIPYTKLNGAIKERLPNNVNVCFRFIEGESMLILLDQLGICASSGSACTSGSLDPSHVLLAIGLEHEIAHGSLRLTLSENNTMEELDFVVDELKKIIERLRAMSPLYEDFIRKQSDRK